LTIQPFFKPDEQPETFNGTVRIDFECNKTTNKLVMHMIDIRLDNSTIKISSQTDTQFSEVSPAWTYDNVTNFLTFELDKPFTAGYNYSFQVSYEGQVRSDLTGFYRTYYEDNAGNKRWLITSQMEYIDARKAFVCFDEPGFKSVYRIRIIHDKSLTKVLSNNRAKNTTK
jgi:aminopeptidase N